MLNSIINGKTLKLLIDELKQELPQQTPWYDAVFGVKFDVFYKIFDGQLMTSIGWLYSEKIDFNFEQSYKQNAYLKIGFAKRLMNNLTVDVSGTAYQHYLQGIQPILYTPKTAKFFAHPYGELNLSIHYRF